MNKFFKRLFIGFLAIIVLALAWSLFVTFRISSDFQRTVKNSVKDYETCAAVYGKILESYPEQCITPDGKNFTRDIGNSLDPAISNLITLTFPTPGQIITSPVTVEGRARGYWYFEASFPVKLTDEYGNLLAISPAQAQDEWMTENFVPFKVTLTFDKGTATKGYLILEKDNPSGDPAKDQSLKIPVKFQ